jgi:signal transduction histidine kinase
MFRQVEGSEIRSSGGVGLGLHIVKKLAELLRAEIGADSEVGKGSKFTLRLPLDFSGPDSLLNDMIPPFGVDAHNLSAV